MAAAAAGAGSAARGQWAARGPAGAAHPAGTAPAPAIWAADLVVGAGGMAFAPAGRAPAASSSTVPASTGRTLRATRLLDIFPLLGAPRGGAIARQNCLISPLLRQGSHAAAGVTSTQLNGQTAPGTRAAPLIAP